MDRLKKFLDNIENAHTSQHEQSDIFISTNKDNTLLFIKQFQIVTQIDFKDKKILEVGFGVGDALDKFREEGARPIGICINNHEIDLAKAKGHEVYKMDQNFMSFGDNLFDVVWSKHCLEHSLLPYYTLNEYKRVTKPGGFLYIEVPAPETLYHHENNSEHFSMFTIGVWNSLMSRLFKIVSSVTTTMVGADRKKDLIYAFILKKEN
jgi:ubiquinone/menaquinone biosynthesis C-methylase UbiE